MFDLEFWIGEAIIFGVSLIVGLVAFLMDIFEEKKKMTDWTKYLKRIEI